MADKHEDPKPTPTQEELNSIARGRAIKPSKAKVMDSDDAEADAGVTTKKAASYSNRQVKAD